MTFLDFAQKVLEKENISMKAGDIWKKGVEKRFDKELGSKGKTPWETLGARLYTDVRDNANSPFVSEGKNPQKFYLKNKPKIDKNLFDEQNETKTIKKLKYSEIDLHPLLVKFVDSHQHFRCKAKTINHTKSQKGKKGSAEWLHPDIVGVYLPYKDYEKTTLQLQQKLHQVPIKLFSFELKLSLTMVELREYYFQALSNSNWANEGYLVVGEIDKTNEELLDELRRLNSNFGIGAIVLNAEFIEQSEILFYATTKSLLDWETIDRLCMKNPDFKNFAELVHDGNNGEYDKVLGNDEYKKYCQEKGLVNI